MFCNRSTPMMTKRVQRLFLIHSLRKAAYFPPRRKKTFFQLVFSYGLLSRGLLFPQMFVLVPIIPPSDSNHHSRNSWKFRLDFLVSKTMRELKKAG